MRAPTGGNRQNWHFVIVTDAEQRRAIGDLYRKGWELYRNLPMNAPDALAKMPEKAATQCACWTPPNYLAEHMHEAPVLFIPCIWGRMDSAPSAAQAGQWGSILPAAWSFMLAARAPWPGHVWTTVHLFFEREAAEVLGIPFEKVTQTALIPVAYTQGTDFAPAKREPLDTVLHWDRW